ncbi:hypothetical protein H7I77_09975 [Mycolicibacterium novocastrense]|uniref:Uncharacterized protein n=1 Tax=Mycolicibacterium novocastrense TaxID=59813 RepID=A0AAW5SIN7_MYCNV|nr:MULTISPECIES: hypothetical protein [Mycolicibacterium]MCV7023673.1 hypothetical protein [Mycolicibacterium novocastrense]MDX1886910.1 hypothetical protein [Mycolicibacterium sp. 120270]GAT07681.1 putative uncharacterized protein [Mycolicibacterium novocastrense]
MSTSDSEQTLDAGRVDELHRALLRLVDKWSEDANLCDTEEPAVAELIRAMMGSLAGVVRLYEVSRPPSSAREDGVA